MIDHTESRESRSVAQRATDYNLGRWAVGDFPYAQRTVLDIGCGPGYFGIRLAPHVASYTGIDHDNHLLSYGRRAARAVSLKNVLYLSTPIEKFVVKPDGYTTVLVFGVLEHIRMSPTQFAIVCSTGLRNGGNLLVESEYPNTTRQNFDTFNVFVEALGNNHMERVDRTAFSTGTTTMEFQVWKKSDQSQHQ